MARITATVLSAAPVSRPNDGAPVLAIVTDHQPGCEAGIYLHRDAPVPEAGQPITWGSWHVWYQVDGRSVVERKVDFSFDPWIDRVGNHP